MLLRFVVFVLYTHRAKGKLFYKRQKTKHFGGHYNTKRRSMITGRFSSKNRFTFGCYREINTFYSNPIYNTFGHNKSRTFVLSHTHIPLKLLCWRCDRISSLILTRTYIVYIQTHIQLYHTHMFIVRYLGGVVQINFTTL